MAAAVHSASASLAQLEIAAKLISDNLQADASRVPDLDVALGIGGGTFASLSTQHIFLTNSSITRSKYKLCIVLRRAC